MKILVVDDSSIDLDIFKQFAKKYKDYTFVYARDANEAIAQIARNPDIDFIITDYYMGKYRGTFMLTVVKSLEMDVPVYLMSGRNDIPKDDLIRFAGVLRKNFLEKDLKSVMIEQL